MIRLLTVTLFLPVALALGCAKDTASDDAPAAEAPTAAPAAAAAPAAPTATAQAAAPADAKPADAKAEGHGHDHGGDHGHDHGGPATQPAAKAPGESPDTRNHADADGVVRRGETLTAAATLPVEQCVAKAKELAGKSVKCAGTVTQVCAKKGCWFALAASADADKAQTVRITSKDYRFFVPTDAVGQLATIEGQLEVKELSISEAQHMADDGAQASGKPAEKITAPQVEVQIASVGVEMKKAGS